MTTEDTDIEPERDLEAMTYEELDEAAELAADEQWRLLSHSMEIQETGSPEELKAVSDAYEAAVHKAEPIYAALAGYELDYDDPAEEVNAALARDQAEEYYARLSKEEIDGPEYVLELGRG